MTATGPLHGLRVISMAEQYPGPYATMIMADLGADVVMVERPGGGDPARVMPAFHESFSRGKRSVVLDLKTGEGREALFRLARQADVLFEGYRPGTLERLGLGPDALRAANPDLVLVSISAFGQTGPYRDRPAHDFSLQAIAGVLFDRGGEGGLPDHPTHALGDLTSGLFGVVAALAGLVARGRAGRGAHFDVAMSDCLVSMMTMYLSPRLRGLGHGTEPEPGNAAFRCADGRVLVLSVAHEDHFWAALCRTLGLHDAAALGRARRLADGAALRRRLADAFAARPLAAWDEALRAAGVPFAPLNGLDEVLADPHFRDRGLFVAPEGGPPTHVRQPILVDGVAFGPRGGPPALGEHTRAALDDALSHHADARR